MEEISKKDLLKITGISYGQLYRWKRMGLIPEDWFIKKASFTGQETYFPKELILERIDKILELKDDISLDDISEIINDHKFKKNIQKVDLIHKNIIGNNELFDFFKNDFVDFNDLVVLKVLDNIHQRSIQMNDLFNFLLLNKEELINNEYLYIIYHNDVIGCIMTKEKAALEFNLNENNIQKINLKTIIDNLKLIILV